MKQLKLSLLLVTTFHFFCFSQSEIPNLKFDTQYYDAVDKWVALPPKGSDSIYILGFIYIDQMAGFTFNYEGSFKISNNKYIMNANEELNNSSIKSRLTSNTRPIAVLTTNQIEQLGVKPIPDWLEIYKSNEKSVEYLKQMGYFYNHVGASKNALEPLLKAYKIEPHHKGLEFELGFAYNATGQFEKAISVLETAIEENGEDQLLYKELVYAFINSKQSEKAEIVVKEGIDKATDDSIKTEMAINMCAMFLHEKDKKRFDKWEKVAKKYVNEDSQYIRYFEYFESEWAKQK